MNQSNQFTEDQIPYHILSRFGFTREMIEDLPEGVIERLMQGRITPVLPVKVETEDGRTIQAYARMSLYRTPMGDVRAMFYPKFEKADLSRFSSQQKKTLIEGKPVVDEKTLSDGTKVKAFYQIDFDTNQVLSTPVAVVENNIKHIANEMQLTNGEHNCLSNGNLLTTTLNNQQVTIGVNLNESPGIRIIQGDEKTWRENEKRDYGKYNFGLNGCWISNDEGGLDYVPEDEYTDDLWDEMKKRGNQLRNASTHRM